MRVSILLFISCLFVSAAPLETTTSQSIRKTKNFFFKVVNANWKYHYKSQVVEFKLKRSGKLESQGNVWGDTKWRVFSPNEMIIEHPNGAKMVMTFDKSFSSFQGKDWDGTAVSGTRMAK